MPAPTAEAVADAMYTMLKDYAGKKNLKAMDLTKAMVEKFGDECDKQTCKDAIRLLMESEKTTYSYVGGSYVVLNPNYQAK
jgi:ATP-dependent protease HslVU (ClpYQ) peptidase subunit